MDKIQIKKKIIEFIKLELERKINFLKKAVDNAQKEAASHKGRMESRGRFFYINKSLKRIIEKSGRKVMKKAKVAGFM